MPPEIHESNQSLSISSPVTPDRNPCSRERPGGTSDGGGGGEPPLKASNREDNTKGKALSVAQARGTSGKGNGTGNRSTKTEAGAERCRWELENGGSEGGGEKGGTDRGPRTEVPTAAVMHTYKHTAGASSPPYEAGWGGGREETRWGRDSRQLFFYRGLDTSLSRIDTGKQFGQVSLRVKSVRLRFLTPDVLQLLSLRGGPSRWKALINRWRSDPCSLGPESTASAIVRARYN
ncbi:hypothetical protein BHE74_00010547 [Ensete ventricosum]|nr:hypothetical protein BHE74_00010547 [Ensete ventricosum]